MKLSFFIMIEKAKWTFRDSNPGPTGYEPVALTNWAKGPKYLIKVKADDRTRTDNLLITNQLLCQLSHIGEMTPRGFGPLLPPWKGDVLTAWPRSLIHTGSLPTINSPSRARTYNNSVNSRVLYHWAIEDYFKKVLYLQNFTQIINLSLLVKPSTD